MIGLLCFVLAVLASPFKSKIRLEAENATLRHQLVVLRRKLKGRAHLTAVEVEDQPRIWVRIQLAFERLQIAGICKEFPGGFESTVRTNLNPWAKRHKFPRQLMVYRIKSLHDAV
jgi:hypothetical protein